MKESLDIATKCSSKEEDWIIRLNEENKKLKEYNWELIENHKKDISILCEENQKLEEEFYNYKKKVSEDMKGIVNEQTENIRLFDTIRGEYKKLEEENKKLNHKDELQEKALIKLCLKHHYDSIIIWWEEVIDMSNYKVVEKKKPKDEKLF